MPTAKHRTDPPTRKQRTNAFSLIEVLLALGIISIALLAVVGIVPNGLRAMGTARESSVEAQLLATIGSQVRLSPFAELESTWINKDFFFDSDGLPFLSGNRGQAAYHAVITDIDKGLELPGGTTTDSIARVRVKVESYQHGRAWADPFAYLVITVANDGS